MWRNNERLDAHYHYGTFYGDYCSSCFIFLGRKECRDEVKERQNQTSISMKTREKIINVCTTVEEYKQGSYSINSIHRIMDVVAVEVAKEQKWNCAEKAVLEMDQLRHPTTGSVEVKDIILSAKNAHLS